MQINIHGVTGIDIEREQVNGSSLCMAHDRITLTVYNDRGDPQVITMYSEPGGVSGVSVRGFGRVWE